MGLFYWGERNGPNARYHRAKKVWIDPHTVEWAGHKVNEKAVREYERNPNKPSDDGDPFVVRGKDGRLHGWNGKHRATAAMRQGRKLLVRLDESEWKTR